MRVTVNHHHYLHFPPGCLTDTEAILEALQEGFKAMSAELDRLTASVAAETTIDASILTLVSGMADQIRANATDPAALNALADQIDAENAKLAAAVAANTPAP